MFLRLLQVQPMPPVGQMAMSYSRQQPVSSWSHSLFYISTVKRDSDQETSAFSLLLNPIQMATRSPAWPGKPDLHQIYWFHAMFCWHRKCCESQISLAWRTQEEFDQVTNANIKSAGVLCSRWRETTSKIKDIIFLNVAEEIHEHLKLYLENPNRFLSYLEIKGGMWNGDSLFIWFIKCIRP